MTMKLTSSKTKIAQVTASVLSAIASGNLRSGDRVVSERRLAAEHGVSLGTAQRALQELEHRGVLTREHGRGTFVRGMGASVDARYLRFRDRDGRDLPVFWHMLKHVGVRATGRLEGFFGKATALVRIDRRVDVGGRFVLASQFFLRERDFHAMSTQLADNTNLRELISQRLALPTLRVEQLIGFEAIPGSAARILKLDSKQRCFVLELRGYTSGDRPIYFQRIHGDLFENATLVIDTHR
jgi:DNA-binding GntR family transcriptional regulator